MNEPHFSVIITTFNRPAQLARALSALARSEYPRQSFEVIVVDDGGTHPVDATVATWRSEMTVKLIRQVNGGPAKGRNRGASAAENAFLAFTDDDCEPAPGWLPALAQAFDRSPHCLVGGRTLNGLTQNAYSTASQLILEMVYAYYNADPEKPRFFASNNIALRADLFRGAGGFNENFRTAEDREFCHRWAHAGRPLLYEPRAVVEHRRPLTFMSFCRQHFGYGCGAARFHHLCALRHSGRLRDHLGFYAGLPAWWRSAGKQSQDRQLARSLPLLAVWQAANSSGFLIERLRYRRSSSCAAETDSLRLLP